MKKTIYRYLLAGCFMLFATGSALAQPTGPQTQFVFEIHANIDDVIVLGETKDGSRQAIPITGGSFEGPDIKGEIIPGGADYQLLRPDGLRELEAVYMMRTDDGVVINVRNLGLINPQADPEYIRTTPVFTAPAGPYEWLNQFLFLGTLRIDPAYPDAVFIQVYKVL